MAARVREVTARVREVATSGVRGGRERERERERVVRVWERERERVVRRGLCGSGRVKKICLAIIDSKSREHLKITPLHSLLLPTAQFHNLKLGPARPRLTCTPEPVSLSRASQEQRMKLELRMENLVPTDYLAMLYSFMERNRRKIEHRELAERKTELRGLWNKRNARSIEINKNILIWVRAGRQGPRPKFDVFHGRPSISSN
ncbi:hypothetical protein Syun_029761 [Stephania yunnanensis]|uniref:Uncharacterized protein n=1 Tax=Stephania yunnanensis TaxID=152371 RepID=A0AAP0E9J3_9MAGN